jgi:hypothetical protein
VANLRARIGCSVELLVIAPDDAVARWAATPIRLGRQSTVTPLVVGSSGVPVVVDPARAIAAPELARVASVMAHGKGDVSTAVEVALAATAGVAELSGEKLVLHSDLIEHALSEAARKAFEMYFPKGYEPLTETGRRLARALADGRFEGRSEAIVAVLAARSISLSDAQRSRLRTQRDPAVLERWLQRAMTVVVASERFDQ